MKIPPGYNYGLFKDRECLPCGKVSKKKAMKKQIVITLTENKKMWKAEISGIINNSDKQSVNVKKTDSSQTGYFSSKKALFESVNDIHIPKIEQWMEQIQ